MCTVLIFQSRKTLMLLLPEFATRAKFVAGSMATVPVTVTGELAPFGVYEPIAVCPVERACARRCGFSGSIKETSFRLGLNDTATFVNGWTATHVAPTSGALPAVVKKLPTLRVSEVTCSSSVLMKLI